jgi:hypothetical protein
MMLSGVGRAPHIFEDHSASTDLSGVPSQVREKLKLSRGEVQSFTSHRGFAADDVESQGAGFDMSLIVGMSDRVPVSDRDAQPGVKLAHSKWFRHVIVCAILKGVDLAVLCTVCGQDHDRDVAPGPDAPAQLEAIEIRQTQVEHNDVGRVVSGVNETFSSRVGRAYLVTERLQTNPTDVEELGVVIDEQYSSHLDLLGEWFGSRQAYGEDRPPSIRAVVNPDALAVGFDKGFCDSQT